MKLQPYFAIDIETLGLAPNAEIVEVACIYDDGISPVEELKTFSMLIKPTFNPPPETYALCMHIPRLAEFGYVPNLNEINALLNRSNVSHKALDDCYDVVYAIRAKFK